MRIYLFCSIALLLQACTPDTEQQIPTYEVQAQTFDIQLSGIGEIEASESEVITSPGRRPMVLSWLEEEYTQVQKGQVIARFDADALLRNQRKEQLSIDELDLDISASQARQSKNMGEIQSEQSLVDAEYSFAQKFTIEDLRLYSQLEIIDSMQNVEFLAAKDEFLQWKQGSLIAQGRSDMELLEIRKQGHQSKFQRQQSALDSLEVKAPYDGLLVYERNWRNELPTVGQTVFPGSAIGKLPNLQQLQARVYILAKDAIQLAPDLPVSLRLDAQPEQIISGKISSISSFPRAIRRASPIKYFELEVQLDNQSNAELKPGASLKADISVLHQPHRLLVPLQSIINEQGKTYLYVEQHGKFSKREVQTGKRNLYFVDILHGIEAGEKVALIDMSRFSETL